MRLHSLFLILIPGIWSFHFSCDQWTSDLIPNRVQFKTKYACVVFENTLDVLYQPFYDSVFIRDTSTGNKTRLSDVYQECNYCVEGEGPWEVVTDDTQPISCDHETILLFFSANALLYPLGLYAHRPQCPSATYVLKTVVLTQETMHLTTTNQRHPVYFGVGIDETEEMFFFDDSPSTQMNLIEKVFSYDYSVLIGLGWGGRGSGITFYSPTNFFYTTAMLGNSEWKQLEYVVTSGHSVSCSIPIIRMYGDIQFDSTNTITIKDQAFENTIASIRKSGFVDMTFIGDIIVYYNSLIEFFVSERKNETIKLYFDLVGCTDTTTTAFPTPTLSPAEQSGSYCACDLDSDGLARSWASQIWLDIVILIDTSKTMGNDGVRQVSGVVEAVVGMMILDSTTGNLFSRVGLIALSDKAEVIYNLNMTSDSDVYLKSSNVVSVDIEAGFEAALTMFNDGERMQNYRPSARQVIYFITNSNPPGILNGAYEFKANGGIIIVTDYIREGQVPSDGLKTLASPNYFFTNLTDDYNFNLQVFCDANCYCPPNLHSYTTDSERQDATGGCYSVANSGVPYKNAVKNCERDGAVMTTIHDDDKQFFISSVVANFGSKIKYWFGYQNDGTEWKWIDNSTNPYDKWDTAKGEPNTNGGQNVCAYSVQTTGLNSNWYATNCNSGYYSVCEHAPCSAGHFCSFDD